MDLFIRETFWIDSAFMGTHFDQPLKNKVAILIDSIQWTFKMC